MSPEERASIVSTAERALRRGDLSQALRLFQSVAAAFPDDEAVREKLALVQESLQPAELTSAKARITAEQPAVTSPIDAAERLASQGKIKEAIAAYRQVLASHPDSPLVRERLTELFSMVQAQAPRAPAPSKEALLTELLDRVGLRRRSKP